MSLSSVKVNKKTVSIWRNQSFLILLSSTFLLSIANRIYELLLPLILYELTYSSVAVTNMRTAELLPNLVFGIFIGVIVDRVNKKKLALWSIGLQTGLLLVLAYMLKINNSWLVPYYIIGFFLMTCNYGYFNAQVGLVKMNIPTEYLNEANAKFSFIETFISVMGPVISGIILLMPVFYDGVLITAIAYFLCLLILSRLSHQSEVHRQKSTSFLADFREGWQAFRDNKALWMMTIFIMLLNSTATVVQITVLLFAKEDLGLASSGVAVVISAVGIGGMAGSLLASKLRKSWGLGVLFGASAFFHAIAYLIMYFSDNYYKLIIALFIGGMATSFYSVCAYTFRLEQTSPELIGRISGITGTFFRIGMPITVFLSGWVIDAWGAAPIFLIAASMNLVVFVVYRTTFLWKLR
ncbi:MFS transporter [Neobacillus vireti]|uniref:Permeases of the major facilitator superfamily protein n=1 Tax=Neobacillus vireti LMG 21834 TaxID=1131730 RepID=A0AB94IK94_9BACI|nr:MFS transporter [Neobacillus vireti]ETI67403.1 permeases of the major facilitator superfamily protein [Neobacillus vireti LMG 21834]